MNETIPEELTCLSCFLVNINPYSCPSGHTHCLGCFGNKTGNFEIGFRGICPTCPDQCTQSDLMVAVGARDALLTVRLICPLCFAWHGDFINFAEHLIRERCNTMPCPLFKVDCCDSSCSGVIFRRDHERHVLREKAVNWLIAQVKAQEKVNRMLQKSARLSACRSDALYWLWETMPNFIQRYRTALGDEAADLSRQEATDFNKVVLYKLIDMKLLSPQERQHLAIALDSPSAKEQPEPQAGFTRERSSEDNNFIAGGGTATEVIQMTGDQHLHKRARTCQTAFPLDQTSSISSSEEGTTPFSDSVTSPVGEGVVSGITEPGVYAMNFDVLVSSVTITTDQDDMSSEKEESSSAAAAAPGGPVSSENTKDGDACSVP